MRSMLIACVLASAVAAPAGEERYAAAVALAFVPATVTIEAGDTLTFANLDPASLTDGHDLTHEAPVGRRLFASDTILAGNLAAVEGVAALEPGLYPFFCTRHPTVMDGVLQVVVTSA